VDISAWTAKEVVDYVVQKINEQGDLCYDALLGVCMYRGPHARRCAAGWLIDDKDYKPEFEGRPVTDPTVAKCIPRKHLNLVSGLQEIHDLSIRRGLKFFNELANDLKTRLGENAWISTSGPAKKCLTT
jgi:hypothetical protein